MIPNALANVNKLKLIVKSFQKPIDLHVLILNVCQERQGLMPAALRGFLWRAVSNQPEQIIIYIRMSTKQTDPLT